MFLNFNDESMFFSEHVALMLIILDCGDPSPTNGIAILPTGSTYGEVAFIKCNDSFVLQGLEHLTCEDGGTWSSNPTCIKGILLFNVYTL